AKQPGLAARIWFVLASSVCPFPQPHASITFLPSSNPPDTGRWTKIEMSCSTAGHSPDRGDSGDWYQRIRARSLIYEKPVQDYLRTFLPCKVPCNLKPPHRALVKDWHTTLPPAALSTIWLVWMLQYTVEDFPEGRKPVFHDLDGEPVLFPFSRSHHAGKVDAVMTFPGQPGPATHSWDWLNIAMNVSNTLADPFGERAACTADVQNSALAWLVINSRNLMLAHGLLAAYSLVFFPGFVRIVRLDHVCLLASQPIQLGKASGVKTLREFFWRLVHPWEGEAGSVVGCDPTLKKMTASDETWLLKQLGDEAQELLRGVKLSDGRLAKVWDDGDDARPPKTFILFKLIDVSARLFSRNTMVWLGIEDTRTGDPAVDDLVRDRPVLRVIKDAWNPVGTAAELECYDRLQATIPEDEWEGLPKRLHGGDLGERDVRRWNTARSGKPWPGEDDLLAYGTPTERSMLTRFKRENVPYPLHRTYTLRLSGATSNKGISVDEERTHVRFVVDVVGRSVRNFRTTKELVAAFRDAIQGHRLAMRYGGILHRDISGGNILIVDRPIPGRRESKGVLHDFDISWILSCPPPEGSRLDESNAVAAQLVKLEPNAHKIEDLKDTYGTGAFFALDVLRGICTGKHARRTFQQDLESFYWVLLSVVFEFTAYSDSLHAYKPWRALFYGKCKTMAAAKEEWLLQAPDRLTIDDNGPLTELMASFSKLVVRASYSRESGKKRKPLKYDTVLKLFDKVLAREDWPVNDPAVRYDMRPPKPPPVRKPKDESRSTVPPSTDALSNNPLKRTRDDDGDAQAINEPSASEASAERGTPSIVYSILTRRPKRPRL
ncbi:hypothetical protein C8Q70DRAFT_331669, partial [Cubamyces menziesii]